MLTKPKLGFLGTGWIGRHRLESVANANVATIVAIADPLAENRDATRRFAPDADCVETLEDLLQHDLDGVVIATPSALHAQQSIAALERGLAVFCQEPLARNTSEVFEVIAVAERADRLLAVDLSYRHVAGLKSMRDLVIAGELGAVFAGDLVFHNAHGPGKPWFYDRALSGGGCLIDLGIHLVDLATWMIQSPVVSVAGGLFAEGRRLKPGAQAIEDYATARLDFESGTVVNIACSWNAHAGQDAVIGVTLFGTDGGAALRNVDGSFTEFRTERFRGTSRELLAEPPDPWGGGAILAWVRQLQTSARFDRSIHEYARAARILDTIYGEPAEATS